MRALFRSIVSTTLTSLLDADVAGRQTAVRWAMNREGIEAMPNRESQDHFLRWVAVPLLLALVPGCRSAVQCCTERIAARASSQVDATPVPAARENSRTSASVSEAAERLLPDESSPEVHQGDDEPVTHDLPIHTTTWSGADSVSENTVSENQQGDSGSGDHQRRFSIPSELPGAEAAPLKLPPFDSTQSIQERRSLAETLFPHVEAVPEIESPEQQLPLTLATLQQMAIDNSPVVRKSAAAVEEARGKAVQAGLCPNPTLGYEGDTIGTAKTAGYNGVFFSQELVTADKLTIAQNAAMMEVRATMAELRKARISLASSIRKGYFRVLVAQEQVKFSRAIARLSEEVYQGQIDLVTGGESAAYEPLQLRVFAVQARNSVVQSQNQLDSVWRQLAADIGIPHLKRSLVDGTVEMSVPSLDYDAAAAVLLQRHSDLMAAQSRIAKASGNLRLQQVTPIPNVTLYGAFQHDDTTPLSDYSTNVQLSVPVPLFDRNQGNIASAHGQLVRAHQDLSDTSNSLMSRLAEVHARRTTSSMIAESYRTDLLPDQVRAYRGIYDRFRVDGESVDFSQLVVAQQSLAQVVNGYLQALSDQWDSTVDLAELLQVDDIVTMDGLAAN